MRKYKHEPNSILVFKEKHGERYFLVPTVEALQKAALKVALERNEEGYWYDFDEEAPVEPKIKLEDAGKFGDNIASAVSREWRDYEYKVRSYKQSLCLKNMLDKIVKEKDGATALTLLQEMSEGEYEGFEVITAEDIE